jgi:hypothetical protein
MKRDGDSEGAKGGEQTEGRGEGEEGRGSAHTLSFFSSPVPCIVRGLLLQTTKLDSKRLS